MNCVLFGYIIFTFGIIKIHNYECNTGDPIENPRGLWRGPKCHTTNRFSGERMGPKQASYMDRRWLTRARMDNAFNGYIYHLSGACHCEIIHIIVHMCVRACVRVMCVRVMCVRVMCVRVMCVRVMCVRVMCVRVMCVRVMCVRVMCVRACVSACVRKWVCACVCVCVRACVSACVSVFVCVRVLACLRG